MSQMFKYLHKLSPDIDQAFESFYDKLLKDVHLTNFFDSQEQIAMLVQKQKMFFINSLTMSDTELDTTYIRLGEYHYDLTIPYVDYIKGMEILEEHFLMYSQNIDNSRELMEDIFEYFKLIKSKTARGYLNKMMLEDEEDIELFFTNLEDEENDLTREIIFERVTWLKSIINALKQDIPFDLDENKEFKFWSDNLHFVDHKKKEFIENLEKRININTKNLFYFYKKNNFLEILPLYSSLLSIYKLTLLLSGSALISTADHLIKNLKMDTLTNLYRKDAFEQFLEKELELFKRHHVLFSVVYLDIDNFKEINDSFGHWSGDKVLEKIGEKINQNIRASDIGFRIGGDEFAIILKDSNQEQTLKICQEIKSEVNKFEFVYNEKQSFFADMSIGFITCENIAEVPTTQEIIKRVDKELYSAKKSGKGKISFS